jgi:GTP-binding protein LepA
MPVGHGDQSYTFNLIDTPGHVDFAYEVNRALAACEGVVLVVDATQGIQAQTLAHYRLAQQLNLVVVPVINKIDLATAEVENVSLQMVELLNIDESEIILASGKTGQGVSEIIEAVIERIPPPVVSPPQAALRALVFNSDYQVHQGVRAWVKVVEGQLRTGDALYLMGSQTNSQALEIGFFQLQSRPGQHLGSGQVGYVITGLKDPTLVKTGDTLTTRTGKRPDADRPLPGYQPPKPMVFVSLYPIDAADFNNLQMALEKLTLVDSSLSYQPESSPLLGNGFRVGFLGLLHAEIVQERLSREFDLEVFSTTPSVSFQVILKNRSQPLEIHRPSDLPDSSLVAMISEPNLSMKIFTPRDYLGPILELMKQKRGQLIDMVYSGQQVQLDYQFPLLEMVGDFFSRLKSISSGFASLDYHLIGWRETDLVRVDYLIAGEPFEALSQIVPKSQAQTVGRYMVDRLAEVIPRHQFHIAIQAAIGGKIIARSTIKSFRKDVTAKLYGGDQTRKDKLLKKQKKGKKKMKQIGQVSLPSDTFLKLLS